MPLRNYFLVPKGFYLFEQPKGYWNWQVLPEYEEHHITLGSCMYESREEALENLKSYIEKNKERCP